jgi:hypothetical protein
MTTVSPGSAAAHNMPGRPETRRFGATVTKPVLATAAAAAAISTGGT